MQQAAFIWRVEDLPRCEGAIERLYFGHEFCQHLIPSSADLEAVCGWARAHSLAVTLVLPFVTDEGLQKALALVERFLELAPQQPEIVVNDWGLLHLLSQRADGPELLLGRLLTKQKRGPRLMMVKDKVPPEMMAHFQRSNIETPRYDRFLREQLRIKRVELDNLLQGMARSSELPASLYYPFAYVTTTRQCLASRCEEPGRNPREISRCGFECKRYVFELKHPGMPMPLFIRGNTQFFRNERLPENLAALHIDRLVHLIGIMPGEGASNALQ